MKAARPKRTRLRAAAKAHVPSLSDADVKTIQERNGYSFKDRDLLVRALSMGQLHHAMMGTAAVAIASAAAIPGTLVHAAAGGGARDSLRFGHPSGTLQVGAQARETDTGWHIDKVVMSRSARVLMDGWVRIPGNAF